MGAATRILREELCWLELAAFRLRLDLDNSLIPPGLVAQQLDQTEMEIAEIEFAIDDLQRHDRGHHIRARYGVPGQRELVAS